MSDSTRLDQEMPRPSPLSCVGQLSFLAIVPIIVLVLELVRDPIVEFLLKSSRVHPVGAPGSWLLAPGSCLILLAMIMDAVRRIAPWC